MSLRALVVVPARLASSRLPRKVLRDLAGRPMICHVVERVRATPGLAGVVVATDADEVLEACRRHGLPAVRTAADHPSGTDRVWEVAQARAADVYVNIQGDEPLVTPAHVAALLAPFRARPDTQVSSLRIRCTPDEVANPNAVKVVVDLEDRALYFSRHPIPYDRDGQGAVRWKHVGLYAYRKPALDRFHRAGPGRLETLERLEQLRFLEHGIPIVVPETGVPTIGVDTEEDLRAAEAALRRSPA